jgi:hypothetical protein
VWPETAIESAVAIPAGHPLFTCDGDAEVHGVFRVLPGIETSGAGVDLEVGDFLFLTAPATLRGESDRALHSATPGHVLRKNLTAGPYRVKARPNATAGRCTKALSSMPHESRPREGMLRHRSGAYAALNGPRTLEAEGPDDFS